MHLKNLSCERHFCVTYGILLPACYSWFKHRTRRDLSGHEFWFSVFAGNFLSKKVNNNIHPGLSLHTTLTKYPWSSVQRKAKRDPTDITWGENSFSMPYLAVGMTKSVWTRPTGLPHIRFLCIVMRNRTPKLISCLQMWLMTSASVVDNKIPKLNSVFRGGVGVCSGHSSSPAGAQSKVLLNKQPRETSVFFSAPSWGYQIHDGAYQMIGLLLQPYPYRVFSINLSSSMLKQFRFLGYFPPNCLANHSRTSLLK